MEEMSRQRVLVDLDERELRVTVRALREFYNRHTDDYEFISPRDNDWLKKLSSHYEKFIGDNYGNRKAG